MNIIDIGNGFDASVRFKGDNDFNELLIQRTVFDRNGCEITSTEFYTFTLDALEDTLKGLERMASVVRSYLDDKETF